MRGQTVVALHILVLAPVMTDREQLRETLDLLHRQLGEAEDVDAAAAAKLTGAIDDIVAVLDKKSDAPYEPSSLGERLGEATRHFEQSHPTLSGTIGRLADILAQMGI